MKSVFRLLPFLFLLGLSAYLPGVRAETCRANIGQTTVNIPNIEVFTHAAGQYPDDQRDGG